MRDTITLGLDDAEIDHLVARLVERDDIGKLNMPASAKRYARRTGLAKMLPGVGPREYFTMVRDTVGGPKKGFPTPDVGVTMGGGAGSGSKGLARGRTKTTAQKMGARLVDSLLEAQRDDRIDPGRGMGGFLNPPTHPEHTQSVELDLRRRPWNRGGMSLSYAAGEGSGVHPATRSAAQRILGDWKKPPLESPEVQDWIASVLGYFGGCYSGNDESGKQSWDTSHLRIDQTADPVMNADLHAGVHLIRKYYPEYTPTAEDFKRAYWGKKPEAGA